MALQIEVCPSCSTKVAAMRNGRCPACHALSFANREIAEAVSSASQSTFLDSTTRIPELRSEPKSPPDSAFQLHSLLQALLDEDDIVTLFRTRRRFWNTFWEAFSAYSVLIPLNFMGTIILAVSPSTSSPWLILWLALILILLVFRFVKLRFIRILRLRANSAVEELCRGGWRPPILYLRPFILDNKSFHRRWYQYLTHLLPNLGPSSPEQRLVKVLARYGPVIAIGRPGEKLPPLGAARIYVSHKRWQNVVAQIVESSCLVVLATGVTDGLLWEMKHLVDQTSPDKLLLCPHPKLLEMGRQESEHEWSRFLATFGEIFPLRLPQHLDDIQFITFGVGYRPLPVVKVRSRFLRYLAGKSDAGASVLEGILQSKGFQAMSVVERMNGRTLRNFIEFYSAVLLAWMVLFCIPLACIALAVYSAVFF